MAALHSFATGRFLVSRSWIAGAATQRLATTARVRAGFHSSTRLDVVKPFLLADIGEGIREVQIIQWFVQPGARVEQFQPLCEVQSDKASVEISSRFDGVIKKLHYEVDDTAIVGKPLVDIDIQSEISPEDEALTSAPAEDGQSDDKSTSEPAKAVEPDSSPPAQETKPKQPSSTPPTEESSPAVTQQKNGNGSLATPAVRHLIKELNLDITQISGTGKDGRVLKEDVQNFAASQKDSPSSSSLQDATSVSPATAEDKVVSLTPVQAGMFKTMTRSLHIPHFLYSTSVEITNLEKLRQVFNKGNPDRRLTMLPFVLKAVSLALQSYPILNAHLINTDSKPQLKYNGSQNIGIAVDSPSGLLVPVVRDVQSHTVLSLAAEISAISARAQAGKLAPRDFQGATVSVSNVGAIGGGVCAPVIVEPAVAIMAIGRKSVVPAFNEHDELVKKEVVTCSWSADHRVVDGATAARCAELVRSYLEDPASMALYMR